MCALSLSLILMCTFQANVLDFTMFRPEASFMKLPKCATTIRRILYNATLSPFPNGKGYLATLGNENLRLWLFLPLLSNNILLFRLSRIAVLVLDCFLGYLNTTALPGLLSTPISILLLQLYCTELLGHWNISQSGTSQCYLRSCKNTQPESSRPDSNQPLCYRSYSRKRMIEKRKTSLCTILAEQGAILELK